MLPDDPIFQEKLNYLDFYLESLEFSLWQSTQIFHKHFPDQHCANKVKTVTTYVGMLDGVTKQKIMKTPFFSLVRILDTKAPVTSLHEISSFLKARKHFIYLCIIHKPQVQCHKGRSTCLLHAICYMLHTIC